MLRAAAVLLVTNFVVQPVSADDEEDFRFQIFVGNADGSELKRLVEIDQYHSQGSPNWSGDGKLIAFDAWKSQTGERFFKGHVFVVNSDGTNPRDLGPGNVPSLSPKGRRIAFARTGAGGDNGIWIMDVEDLDSKVQIDTRGFGPEWSPDGTRVVYTRGNNLMAYSLIEGTLDPLLNELPATFDLTSQNFSWSPDSRQIAFRAMKDGKPVLAIVDARGEEQGLKIVYEGEIQPALAWHPNDKQIVVTINDPNRDDFPRLYTIDIQNPGPPVLMPNQPDDRKLGDPSFSPDGRKLAVLAFKRTPPSAK